MSAPVSSSSSHNRHEEMENGVRERECQPERSKKREESSKQLLPLHPYVISQ